MSKRKASVALEAQTAELSAAEILFKCDSIEKWNNYLSQYDEAVQLVTAAKKKADLPEIDRWVWNEISQIALSRSPKHITLAELSKIMRWKLMRGKFRPIQGLVDRNSPADVIKYSESAIKFCLNSDWKSALSEICKLGGIGVATGSVIIALFCPQHCFFMADEVIEACFAGKRDYTVSIYKEIQESLQERSVSLGNMPVESLGKAIWTAAVLQQYATTNSITKNKK